MLELIPRPTIQFLLFFPVSPFINRLTESYCGRVIRLKLYIADEKKTINGFQHVDHLQQVEQLVDF